METEKLRKPLLILSSILPPIGFVLYFHNRISAPHKAKMALVSALIGILIAFLMNMYVIPFVSSHMPSTQGL